MDHAIKVMGVSADAALLAKAQHDIAGVLGSHASVVRAWTFYLDITPPEANKGNVVTALARHFGCDPKTIVTIGDNHNDVSMFQKSGFSIAMGNATADVQAMASTVTAANTQDGFALAIERLILGKEG